MANLRSLFDFEQKYNRLSLLSPSVYHDRMRLNAQNQRDWADQQVREHRHQAAMDREEEKNWAEQEEAILRMRGMLEDENQARKVAHHRAIVEENKRMAQQKRDREQADR